VLLRVASAGPRRSIPLPDCSAKQPITMPNALSSCPRQNSQLFEIYPHKRRRCVARQRAPSNLQL
jgi:hypothetical protein